MMVQHIEDLQKAEGLSYELLCVREGIPYGSFRRWQRRINRQEPVLRRPGPAKVQPLDFEELRAEIQALRHGRKRTEGTGQLHQRYSGAISRRDFRALVEEEHRKKARERNRVYNQVTWLVSRLIWATDDTEYRPDKAYPKAYLHNVQDLASRYKFEPWVGLHLPKGEDVAAHLAELFETHGPPLFFKRDNGGNLNHRIVEELLAAFLVIPINSPCYYPQYNGGIEAAQREIKARLARRADQTSPFLAIQAGLDVHALNHKRRRCLRRRSSCQVFASGIDFARTFTRPKRKEVYEAIKEMTLELTDVHGYDAHDAWRLAVETWLLDNRFITVSKKRKVLPGFPGNTVHL
jgi:hypothetical protein